MDGKTKNAVGVPRSTPIDIPKKKGQHNTPGIAVSPLSKTSNQLTAGSSYNSNKSMAAGSGGKSKDIPVHRKLLRGLSKYSHYGSGSIASSGRINVVANSCTILPSLASTMSLDVNAAASPPPLNDRVQELKSNGEISGDSGQISTSCQENLECIDPYENPAYLDTIQSTDSTASSLLRRTFSLPSDYCYNKKSANRPLHAKEIWCDFMSGGGVFDEYDEKSSMYSSREMSNDVHGSQSSVDEKKMWRQTMEDLMDRPEYVDSLESTSSKRGLLAIAAKSFAARKNELYTCKEVDETIDQDELIRREKKKYKKNLLILSLAFLCTFTAYISLRNLQSSVNDKGGLGMFSLCTVYATLFCCCMFSPAVVVNLRPRNTLILTFSGCLIYSFCNFYPSYYTLLPASAIVGFCMANSWTAQATYLANIAAGYSQVSGETLQNTLSKFNGLFYLFFQSSIVIGGVISSIVLMGPTGEPSDRDLMPNTTNLNLTGFNVIQLENVTWPNVTTGLMSNQSAANTLVCGSGYCSDQAMNTKAVDINPAKFYTLTGILTGFSIAGIVIVAFFLDPLEGAMKRKDGRKLTFMGEVLAVFRIYTDWRALCLTPYILFSFMQMSFLFGEFTKATIVCV